MSDLRVLVVDDEATMLALLQRFFVQRGDACRVAANGADALHLLEDQIFDLLLTDMVMPQMDGIELIKRAKSLQPHMACILMSGLGTRGDIIAALKAGVFDFVDKPIVKIDEFTMIVDRAGESSRVLQERDALLETLKQQNARLEFSLLRLHEAFGQMRQQEEALESDLVKAQQVQRKFLPAGFPRRNGLDLFGYFAPCEHLGGDFFGVVPLGGGKLAVYLVDVAGHGVSAAMVTVTLRELMRAPNRHASGNDLFAMPAQVLAFMNEALLQEGFDPPIFVTMVYTVFDPASGRVAVATAGHPPPLLISGPGENRLLPVQGPVLGTTLDQRFETAEVTLQPGDVVLFYSDGLPEARSGTEGEFSATRLHQTLASCHGWTAARVGEMLGQTMLQHLNGLPAADDMTFIVASRPLHDSAPRSEPDGAIVPGSVKIVMPSKLRFFPPEGGGRIKGGWAQQNCIIRLGGTATWQLAPTLREIIKRADTAGAAARQIDLAECEAMDSTILGLLLQHAGEVVLHLPGSRVVGQLHEMGVLERFTISHVPCQPFESPIAIEPGESREPCSDLILSAHEALMEVSASNRQHFKEVVATLRNRQNQSSTRR